MVLAANLLLSMVVVRAQNGTASHHTAFVDRSGVIRWSDTKQELALFGVNYCLPSACDYRAAGYVTNDRKRVVDQDMAHFARMSFDGIRLSFWGDWQNTDHQGNLIENDHLDLLDYVISKASERGIYMLLSPIVTYSSQWPDAMGDTSANGFSAFFKKSELGSNPDAIAAQCNYLRQLLNHINRYTGKALKDEPSILFVEMINEPTHHSQDVEGSVKYINALVDAVRSTGCKKILFHNISQDFDIAKAMEKSKIQGGTFAWYPSGLNSGSILKGNYLPVVDEYSSEMVRPELSRLAKIVYEFDSPDLLTGYMYPAMARSFRRVGAQWASMFSYDMLATAPYNLGWQTHYLNMVYTPVKAASAIIAGEVMRRVPRNKDFGRYPLNTTFGDFHVSYDSNLAVMSTPEKLFYTNSTSTAPMEVAKLRQIVGYGSSPAVQYEGQGLYFLDKVREGVWRLEVYPDAVRVQDPFQMPSPGKVVVRTLHHTWPMIVNLPDLGTAFEVSPLNQNNSYAATATAGRFNIQPGVYILSKGSAGQRHDLPAMVNGIKMTEFICPEDQDLPTQIVIQNSDEFVEGRPMKITAAVVSKDQPDSVILFARMPAGRWFYALRMKAAGGYNYEADIAQLGQSNGRGLGRMGRLTNPVAAVPGSFEYCIVVAQHGQVTNYPSGTHVSPADWNYYPVENYRARLALPGLPLQLMDPDKDISRFAFTRIGDDVRSPVFKVIPDTLTGGATIRMSLPLAYDRSLDDYTISLSIKDKMMSYGSLLNGAKAVVIRARGIRQKQEALLTLVEKDGTSWSSSIPVRADWEELSIPIAQLKPGKGVMLPLGYPGRWDYWFSSASGRGGPDDHVRLENVEWIQLSMRQSPEAPATATKDSYIDISAMTLSFD